jgi:glycosyltransferase involved in cell wall biosynthesis
MRVLQVLTDLRDEGAEQAAVDLAGAREPGLEAHLVYLREPSEGRKAAEEHGVEVHGPLCGDARLKSCVAALKGLVRDLDTDIVHSHLTLPGIWCAALRRQGKVRMVHTAHERAGELSWAARKLQWPRIVARADRVVCLCGSLEAELVARYPAARGKTVVIPRGVDPRRVAPRRSREDVRREMGLPSDALVVLHVADVAHRSKGHIFVIDAMRQVCDEYPYTYLLVAGDLRDQALARELNQRIAGLDLQRRVKLLGARGDVPDLLGASDILALPSLHEAAPMTVVEAMMVGLPVVSTPVGACPEMVADGETGILVPPGNADALATAIMELAGKEPWRLRLGAAAKERALRLYSLEHTQALHAEMYRELLGQEEAGG